MDDNNIMTALQQIFQKYCMQHPHLWVKVGGGGRGHDTVGMGKQFTKYNGCLHRPSKTPVYIISIKCMGAKLCLWFYVPQIRFLWTIFFFSQFFFASLVPRPSNIFNIMQQKSGRPGPFYDVMIPLWL